MNYTQYSRYTCVITCLFYYVSHRRLLTGVRARRVIIYTVYTVYKNVHMNVKV